MDELSSEQIAQLLSARKHPLAECESCPFVARPMAPTQGPENSEVIFVSRSPGYHEAMAGKPFAGPSGKVLDFMLGEQGVSRKDIRLTNVVLCAPTSNNKVPKEAIKACKPRLDADLSSASLIIAGGAEAIAGVFGKARSIQSVRGYRHTLPSGQTVVATNNPALVIRDDGVFPNLRSDFKRAFNPAAPPTLPTVSVYEDERSVRGLLRDLDGTNGIIAADIESRGGLRKTATLISLQFATEGGQAHVIGERGGLFNNTHFIEGVLRPFFANESNRFLWHNGSFDTKILRHTYGCEARIDEDTILLSYAVDERPGTHALDYLLMNELDWPKYDDDEIAQIKKTGIVTDYDKFYTYAGLDVAGTYQLFYYLRTKAEKDNVY